VLSDEVKDRLVNWKFEQAWRRLTHGDDSSAPTQEEAEVVQALADMLGDPGWFEGNLGVVIDAALTTLTGR
jgi:hypothetical protein